MVEVIEVNKPVGHEPIRKALDRMVESGHLPSVLLFAGPDGVGKRTLAQDFMGKLLSAENRVAKGLHPDIRKYRPELKSESYSVAQIEDFIQEVSLLPFEGPYRFFLFYDAHQLKGVHANRLLKTLEEMPDHAVVILFTTESKRLLDTITSRSITFHFFPLVQGEIAQILREKGDLTEGEIEQYARQSEGSLSRALDMLELKSLKELTVQALLAATSRQMDSAYDHLIEIEKAIEAENEEGQTDKERRFLAVLSYLFYWVRDIHLMKESSASTLLYYPEQRGILSQLSTGTCLSLEGAKKLEHEAIDGFEKHIKPKVLLHNYLLRLSS